MIYPRVYFSSFEDFEKILRTPTPEMKFPVRSVFNYQSYLFEEPEFSEMCPFFISGTCKFGNKCKNYHPLVLIEAECMICNVKIKANLRKFGVLSNCCDVFCFPCIRQWRSRGNVSVDLSNSCPVCHKNSRVLVSSSIYPQVFEDKVELIDILINSKSK
jgi:hypothetical protein